jgi:hypothetical protein
MKLRNGSLKDYVPSHYPLGFLLVNYGYEKYGANFWKNVTLDAAAFKGLIYPFQKAIKKHAGVDYKSYRKAAFDFYKQNSDIMYKSVLQPAQDKLQGTSNSVADDGQVKVSKPTLSFVSNYYFPVQLSADSLLYVKNSYRSRSSFMLNHGGREQLLRNSAISWKLRYTEANRT